MKGWGAAMIAIAIASVLTGLSFGGIYTATVSGTGSMYRVNKFTGSVLHCQFGECQFVPVK